MKRITTHTQKDKDGGKKAFIFIHVPTSDLVCLSLCFQANWTQNQ